MTYPVLLAARGYAHIEVREGSGAAGWNQMSEIFAGACTAGQSWSGGEGGKLAARHCMWPDDPGSTLSQPYIQSSTAGLQPGVRELLRFPSGV